MTNHRFIVVAAIGLLAGTVSVHAGIQGSQHDMSGKGWGTTELCKFCHTPHLSQSVVGAPLWNHQSTVQTYTLYSSASFVGASTQTQPGPQSKLCLSCHDGTVAIDSFANGGINRVGTQFMTTTNKVGGAGSLGNDHPIAFTYNAALAAAAKHLNTPASTSWADAAQTLPLYNGKMECATCHSVHDNTYTKFMRVSNAGSAMCITCHTY